MSGRGTITSRTRVSPNSKIEWIRSFSSSSMAASSDATSAMALISSSVASGPWGSPRPGMIAFATLTRTAASGPMARCTAMRIGATRRAHLSVCWTAHVFGVTSAKMNSRIVITTVDTSSLHRWR